MFALRTSQANPYQIGANKNSRSQITKMQVDAAILQGIHVYGRQTSTGKWK